MRKDSFFIFGTSVILTALIIGGVYYMTVVRNPASEKTDAWQTLSPNQPTGYVNSTPDISAETSQRRTDTPIKCQDPEIGEYWTNAATCEGADLHNRLSHAAPLVTSPDRKKYSGQDYTPPAKQAANSRTKKNSKPNLRFNGKSPPPGLNISCRFSVGKALEIERDLAAADDPKESTWRENYCKWRCEAVKDQCPVEDSYFYYQYTEICGMGYTNNCQYQVSSYCRSRSPSYFRRGGSCSADRNPGANQDG